MAEPIAWARGRPSPLRLASVGLLALVALAAVATLALAAAGAAADAARDDADARLLATAAAASDAFARRVDVLERDVRALARRPDVVRALDRGATAPLERFAAERDGVAFTRAGRLLAGAEPERAIVRRSIDVMDGGRVVGQVAASLVADPALVRELARASRPATSDRVLLAVDEESLDGTGPTAARLPERGVATADAGGAVRAAAMPLVAGRDDVRVVAVTPLAAVEAAAGERWRRVLLAVAATALAIALLATTAFFFRSQRARAARRERAERDRRRVREALSLVGDALAATHDTEALLPVIVQTAMEAAGATEARLLRGDEEVIRAGRRSASRSPLVLPLGVDDDGVPLRLAIYSGGGGPSEDARDLAEWFVSQASVALENARLHGIVKRQAVTDDLTLLANRRRFLEALADELSRAQRFETELAVVIADLDDFKSVNDRFGHEYGNEVLRAFGEVMRRTSRDVDVAARLGGEEFAMLLPQTDLDGAVALAERLREELRELELEAPDGSRLRVTASFGVSGYPPTPSVDELLRLADAGLYRAKAEGKDRVSLAG